MERRTEMAWRQRLQLSRRERARRERPWLVVASSVLAFSMLQRLLELWREAKRERRCSSGTCHRRGLWVHLDHRFGGNDQVLIKYV